MQKKADSAEIKRLSAGGAGAQEPLAHGSTAREPATRNLDARESAARNSETREPVTHNSSAHVLTARNSDAHNPATHELVREDERLHVYFEVGPCLVPTVPAHWHNYVELIYLLSGKFTAVVQTKKYTLHPGDLLIINSRDLHMTINEDAKTTYLLLQIPAGRIAMFIPDFELISFFSFIPAASILENEPLHEQLQSVIFIGQQKSAGQALLFTARLYDLLYLLYRDYSAQKAVLAPDTANQDFQRIVQVVDWIRGHYNQPLTLAEAAGYLGLSKEYFCRLFRRYTGQTFLEYLNSLRVISLYEELKTSELPIPMLMEKHGLTNYKVFLRYFRTIYHTTPQKAKMMH